MLLPPERLAAAVARTTATATAAAVAEADADRVCHENPLKN